MSSTKSPSERPERKLPVRLANEPLRSRRISSPSFSRGLRLSFIGKSGPVEAKVEEVSIEGVRCVVAASAETFNAGDVINEMTLTYFDQELYRGSGEVKHVESTDEGVRAGFWLSSQIVDMHALHRTAFRMSFRQRWRKTLRRSLLPPAQEEKYNDIPGIRPDFARWIFETRALLMSIKSFFDEEEAATRKEDLITQKEQLEDILTEARTDLVPLMIEYSENLSKRVSNFTEEEHKNHGIFFREQLGDLFFECPFSSRAFKKPLGYAGDYELMNILYRKEPEGNSIFGKLLNLHSREEPAGKATFNRLVYMDRIIRNCIASTRPERARIASIGCGAAKEVYELLTNQPELGSGLDLALVDQDTRALQHCEITLGPLALSTGAKFSFINNPIQQLIKAEHMDLILGRRQLIYSVGLYDYLDDATFESLTRALYDALEPGGKLVIGNMAAHNPTKTWMAYATDWFLIHRSADELTALAVKVTKTSKNVKIDSEPTGVNLFLHIEK